MKQSRFLRKTAALAFLLACCMMAGASGGVLEPSQPCPSEQVPPPRDDGPRWATPSIAFPDEPAVASRVVASRVVVLTNWQTPLSVMPVAVLVLRDDHLLIFSRAVLDLGAPLQADDPRLKEYFSVQLTEEQVSDFHTHCLADGLFDDVGTETTLAGIHWNDIILSNGESRTWITAVHLGYSADLYVSPTFGPDPLLSGETQESMLLQEDIGYRRSREAWDQAFSKTRALIPEDEGLWTRVEGVHSHSFNYGFCPPLE